MKRIYIALFALAVPLSGFCQKNHEPMVDISLRLESLSSIDRAVSFLLTRQKENGSFSNHPGITAMTTIALAESPQNADTHVKAAIAKARRYILSKLTADGAVSLSDLKQDVYSTSICLMALSNINDPADKAVIHNLRTWLIKTQMKKTGGFSYGTAATAVDSSYPDLSNTHWALEALALTEPKMSTEPKGDELQKHHKNLKHKLADFITSCQIDKADAGAMQGGFLYYPIAKQPKKSSYKDTDKVWGSLSMGALKSLVFSGVPPTDPRIVNGLTWNSRNYTVAKNPGLGQGGWFYYSYMFSSAMLFLRQDTITTPDKRVHNWRSELLEELLSRQVGGDHWENTKSTLWMESDANLCTAYALKAVYMVLIVPKR